MSSQSIRLFTRREFITRGVGMLALASTIPSFLGRSALLMAAPEGSSGKHDGPILVVIQLSGGNDGLNTVVPFGMDDYYRLRPTLGIAKDKVVKVTDTLGFHPSLTPLKSLYDEGTLGIVQGVGYPNPDRSHFRSMEIWQSGVVDGFESTGWVGRMFDSTCGNAHLKEAPSPTLGVSIGETLNPALNCNCSVGVALKDAEQFFNLTRASAQGGQDEDKKGGSAVASQVDFLRRTSMNASVSANRIRRSVGKVQSKTDYPTEPFAQSLKLIAGMIAGGMDTKVYYASLTGFDTHANQLLTHERLLKTLADGIHAFQKDLEALGQADRVLGITFSEFGRRVKENGSKGTDHGQAAPMFVFGKKAKSGFIGDHPSMSKLNDGDLKFHTDFRQVYSTVLDKWMKVDPTAVFSQKFDALPIVA